MYLCSVYCILFGILLLFVELEPGIDWADVYPWEQDTQADRGQTKARNLALICPSIFCLSLALSLSYVFCLSPSLCISFCLFSLFLFPSLQACFLDFYLAFSICVTQKPLSLPSLSDPLFLSLSVSFCLSLSSVSFCRSPAFWCLSPCLYFLYFSFPFFRSRSLDFYLALSIRLSLSLWWVFHLQGVKLSIDFVFQDPTTSLTSLYRYTERYSLLIKYLL